MAVDLRDLALFVAVVDGRSITAGAAASGMSLSAASTRLTRLERTLGIALLRRSRGGVALTHAGETFDQHARRVLEEAESLDRGIAAHARGMRDELRLASNTSAVDSLTEFLAATLARFPDLRVVLTETSSTEAVDQVRAGRADMAVVSIGIEDPTLAADELWPDPLVLVHGATATNAPLTFHDALRRPLIGLPEDSPLQALIDREAAALGITPTYRVRLPTLGAVYAVATTGAGVGIIPRGTAQRLGAEERSLRPLDEPWARRTAWLIRRTPLGSGEHERFATAMLRYRSELADQRS